MQFSDREYAATVVGFDASAGLVLLRNPDLPGGSLDQGRMPSVGELSVTVACPIPAGYEARMGMIRCVGGETRLAGGRRVASYFQTDAARFRGFAGSVVFGPDGQVWGMTMPVHRREEAFALPVGQLLEIAVQLREGTLAGTGYLGVQATAVDPARRARGFHPRSPGDRRGIRQSG